MSTLAVPVKIRVEPAWYAPSRYEAVVTSSTGRVGVGTSEGSLAALDMALNNAWIPYASRQALR